MLDVNDVGFSCSNIAAIIMSLKVEHHEFQGPQRQKKRSNASFIMQKLRPKLYIYHKICSQHFEELLTVKFLEQRKYKNYSIQSICRAFSLPKRWGKKRGSFKIGIIFDWMESFLFCLCSRAHLLYEKSKRPAFSVPKQRRKKVSDSDDQVGVLPRRKEIS